MVRAELAARIYEISHLTGEFTLRSGAVSDQYFDKYLFEADPQLLAEIVRAMLALVPDEAEVLAGLELGGVPLATALSLSSGRQAAYVRKQAKTYGTRKLAEGADVSGRNVVVVEDVISSGGQVVESTQALRELGAVVDTAICVIDRRPAGTTTLSDAGIALRALFTMEELTPR